MAARVLSPLAAGVAAWLAFALVRFAAGEAVATFALLALLATPAHVRYAIEAGTDAPALALMLASTWLVVREGRAGSRFLAGLLAGYAVITRSNAVFLLPCAALAFATRPKRIRALLAYAIGVSLPLGGWGLLAARAGGLPVDRNYLNVCWELYGQGVPWARFEATIGARFHSLAEVLAYDPLRAGLHILRNLFVQRFLDFRELTTPWLGVLALPGVVLLLGARQTRVWLSHALACSLVLAMVFYSARFGLYLLPFYLGAAGASLAWLASRLHDAGRARSWCAGTLRFATSALGLALVVFSGGTAAFETARHLADAPHETRIAGRALARMGLSDERILARKPHVAYFAGIQFVPLPTDQPLSRLSSWARAAGTRYLYYSGLEQVQRPEYGVLADSGVSLPGFEQILWGRLARDHFYSVYRLTNATADSAAFAGAYRAALLRYESRRRGSPEALLFVAVQQLDLGAPSEALVRLDRLERLGVRNPVVEKLRSLALFAIGDLEGAAEACRKAMTLETPTGWHWANLGEIRARQGRYAEARDCFGRAVQLEPASLDYLESLGRADISLEDYAGAASAYERCVRLAPRDASVRRFAMGAWRLAGNETRARQLYDEGVNTGLSPAALMGEAERAR